MLHFSGWMIARNQFRDQAVTLILLEADQEASNEDVDLSRSRWLALPDQPIQDIDRFSFRQDLRELDADRPVCIAQTAQAEKTVITFLGQDFRKGRLLRRRYPRFMLSIGAEK